MKDFIQKVAKIQSELKCHKSQYNKFGDYSYRTLEDIQEAVKPHLDGLVLTFSDELVYLGDNYYVRATATITNGEHSLSNVGVAREELEKKKFSPSQLTGTASSYSRKYAAAGLFLLDDTKDADSQKPVEEVSRPSYTVDMLEAFNRYIKEDKPLSFHVLLNRVTTDEKIDLCGSFKKDKGKNALKVKELDERGANQCKAYIDIFNNLNEQDMEEAYEELTVAERSYIKGKLSREAQSMFGSLET